jgi:hypothetical protein
VGPGAAASAPLAPELWQLELKLLERLAPCEVLGGRTGLPLWRGQSQASGTSSRRLRNGAPDAGSRRQVLGLKRAQKPEGGGQGLPPRLSKQREDKGAVIDHPLLLLHHRALGCLAAAAALGRGGEGDALPRKPPGTSSVRARRRGRRQRREATNPETLLGNRPSRAASNV